MATEQTTESILDNVAAGLDHFDPFQGFVDDDKKLNIRYGFRLGKVNFLVNELAMCEVVKEPVVYPIPNTPIWIQGLINLRGILVPVLNIKKHIQQQTEEKESRNTLLVINKGENAFATFLEALPDSLNIDNDDFSKVPKPDEIPKSLEAYITDVYEFKNEVWLELNYDEFIKNMTKDYSDS